MGKDLFSAEALGCGGEVTEEHLQATEEARAYGLVVAGLLASQCLEDLRKMFVTLPKNSNGRLERRSLRLEDQFVNKQFCSPNGSRQCFWLQPLFFP